MAGALERFDGASDVTPRDGVEEPLSAGAARWLEALPDALRPRALPQRFPHMANALAMRWDHPAALRLHLDELLIDNRGNRQGLPLDVAEELATVKDYYETVLHPVPQTVWDEVAARRRST